MTYQRRSAIRARFLAPALVFGIVLLGCGKPDMPPADKGKAAYIAPVSPKLTIDTGWKNGVSSVSLSADGKRMAVFNRTAQDNNVQIWDIPNKKKILERTDFIPRCLAMSPDGKTFVDTYKIRDSTTGNVVRDLNGQEEAYYSPTGELLVTRDTGAISIYEVGTGKEKLSWVADPEGKKLRQIAVAWEPVSQVASYHDDGTVRVWDLKTGKLLHELVGKDASYAVAITADGKRIACGSSPIVIWDVPSGSVVHRLDSKGLVYHLNFLPDNKTLIYPDKGVGAIVLENLDTGAKRMLMGYGQDSIYGLSVTADGKMLAGCSDNDPAVKIWDIQAP
jgi:WD40 repeat protein